MEIIAKALGNTSAGSIAVSSGYYLREIIQIENAGNKVMGGIMYGSTPGGNDIVASFNLGPSDKERICIDGYNTPATIYFDAVSSWNGASVDIYLVLGSLT